ncbi:hypothetical protein P3X46_000467 [Hevea brasiliensis]|uniref:Disease resistance RPP13-like protein 1 n=1 Tax=Hevea brasiliensis TaxID=3981 RepID=A0ABQ9N9P2_HEVBR|nr:putative disease resistance RPP13-like protein 1 [Hevea brasiliensis]KAJ9189137.1 hypothetical protein P3X46_000467 [Hevea brasiliensis]
MDAAAVGGAFLSAFLQVLFDRVASPQVVGLFQTRRPKDRLLKKLKTTLVSVNGLLDDAEEKQIIRLAVKRWLDELKVAVYEADDLLDEIAYEALRSELEAESQTGIDQVRKFFTSVSPFKNEIEGKLEEILERFDHLVKQKDVLGLSLREGFGEHPSSQKIPTTSLVDESAILGRDDDKETIIKLLLDDGNRNELDVIPIVGMGGVGKTTLAQLIYNDNRVQDWFDLKIWVCVSEEFDVFRLTRDILKETGDFRTLDELQVVLKEKLMGKKFLLVLDDVWSESYDDWDILQRPLKYGAKGSKIVVTTRNESVALIMRTVPSHYLKELSHDDCWLLFVRHAFENGNSDAYPDLEVIGKKIAKKCDGLPLAAKVLGGLMRSKKKDVNEWDAVLQSNMWDLASQNILPTLRLSYYHLPSHSKQCFAYCAIYPKDYEFDKDDLVLRWKAEGLLVQPSNMDMEEIDDSCFHDLVARSFFQPSKTNESGFMMHDLIHDLAKFVSGEFCLRLEGDDLCKISRTMRYLSYGGVKYEILNKILEISTGQHLRTFTTYQPLNQSRCQWARRMDDDIKLGLLSKFKRLRVLSLSDNDYIVELSDVISNWKHLRYLNLSGAAIKRLPEIVSTLYNLQIVILYRCRRLIELPTHIARLINLCHLDIRDTGLQEMPSQMGRLTKLQSLSDFFIGERNGSSLKELGKLQYLQGELSIHNLQNVVDVEDASESNLKGKRHLRKLELLWNGDPDDSQRERSVLEQLQPHTKVECLFIKGYGGTKFPDWLGDSSFSTLVKLKLYGCRYCSSLPPLGQLASLKELDMLSFYGVPAVGPEFYGNCTSNEKPFRSLEILSFADFPEWYELIPCVGAFSCLQELHIFNCPFLTKALPTHLPSLTKLQIDGCQQLVVSFPPTPSIVDMVIEDDSRDVRLEKLASGLYGLRVSGSISLDLVLEWLEQMHVFPATLEAIQISNCDSLRCFSLELFPELKRLVIFHCLNLEWLYASQGDFLQLETNRFSSKLELLQLDCSNKLYCHLQWILQTLPSLSQLSIHSDHNAESFPEITLLPSSLTSLEIHDFQNLKSLDRGGLQHLKSLKQLTISGCPMLSSIPDEGLASSISLLCIMECPLLGERCQQGTGEDWSKISHIPHIEINWEKIN